MSESYYRIDLLLFECESFSILIFYKTGFPREGACFGFISYGLICDYAGSFKSKFLKVADPDTECVVVTARAPVTILQEVLNGVLFNELVNLIRPGLTDIAAVHEAGHVAISYLAGCPVSTYSLGT